MASKTENSAVNDLQTVPVWTSYRYRQAYWGLLGTLFVFLLRINFSVAIVCMTYDPEDNSTGSINQTSSYPASSPFEHIARNIFGLQAASDTCPDDDEDGGQETGEFGWSRELRGTLSSSFFWGYIATQFVGGWLAVRYGGKNVALTGMTASCITTLLSPPLARLSPIALMVVRLINGLGQGVYYPATFVIWANWFPAEERSFLLAVTGMGSAIGSVISFAASGFICVEMGWAWIFWIYGISSFIWIFGWYSFVYDSPNEHPHISEAERKYITDSQNTVKTEKNPPIPWRAILTSTKVWCLVVNDFCITYAYYSGVLQFPQYFQDVLQVNIQQNGLYNSLPQLGSFVALFVFTSIGDWVLRNNLMKKHVLRKTMQTVATLPSSLLLIALGFMDCNTIGLAVALMTLEAFLNSAKSAGSAVTRIDMAPRFAGIIMGMCNTSANLSGVISPIVIANITTDGTREQWMICFMMSAGFMVIAFLSFTIFSSPYVQEWAKLPEDRQNARDPDNNDSINCHENESKIIATYL